MDEAERIEPHGVAQEMARERLRRRKKRKTTSCWPCRDRKVKCDTTLPCGVCRKRGHADLCTYETLDFNESPASVQEPPGRTVENASPSALSPPITGSAAGPTTSPSQFREHVDPYPETLPHQTTIEPYLGSRSIPAFVRDTASNVGDHQSSSRRRGNVENGIMPMLGLKEPSRAYPFLPLDPSPSRLSIHDALPSDREVIKFFQCHRSQIHPFTPNIADIERFEVELCTYLENRPKWRRPPSSPPTDPAFLGWLALLYALLASGAQFSDLPYQQRSSIAHSYMVYSFHCMRLANFLLKPTVDCVQSLLVLGNVLQNDMQPDAAWMMLGTTIRMAQSLGLHQTNMNEDSVSRKVWFAVIWQDSLLSMCFDRPSMVIDIEAFRMDDVNLPTNLSYTDAMRCLAQIGLKGINVQKPVSSGFQIIASLLDEIESIYAHVEPHLRQLDAYSNIQHRCEYYALRLHTSFVMAWLSRGAMRRNETATAEVSIKLMLVSKCKTHLLESLRAYLGLQHLCILALRSWPMIHNGISSALLLGLIGETRVNPEVRELQRELISLLSARDADAVALDSEDHIALSRLHSRALVALKDLFNDQAQPAAPPLPDDPTGQVNLSSSHAPSSATQSSDMMNGSFQPPIDVMAGLSPLEMFDSIVWGLYHLQPLINMVLNTLRSEFLVRRLS
ncbi:MAG: hypothetical protein M1818_002509 [Claussenomyces sp. TS43310]|nr:MAG: hypothetical protein M1818_002509 [Claussenomyces sp. TS43310]